jgi:hypothetical protein
MTHSPVNFSEGLPETVLPAVDDELVDALDRAMTSSSRHQAIASILETDPTFLNAWARLSETAQSNIEAYAYARVGYHRGLDALRKAGWRGSGYVRWSHVENQGFLRCLEYLRQSRGHWRAGRSQAL